jgi:hypothetical protein
MAELDCPFHVECQFHNSTTKTPDDESLADAFCRMRYEDCEIAQRILAGQPVPAGAGPDGTIRG